MLVAQLPSNYPPSLAGCRMKLWWPQISYQWEGRWHGRGGARTKKSGQQNEARR